MLTLNNISAKRGNKILFQSLSITLGENYVLQIKGENGSGKSTLLKIIAGLIKPEVGEILYANENVLGDHYPEYCTIIQYIGHKNALKMDLSVEENLKFYASLKGSREPVDSAIAFFKLSDYRNRKVRELSAGWQKRVALSRLMLSNSEVWILDEPYVNLDSKGRQLLDGLIKTRCENRGTVIIASHEDSLNLDNLHVLDLKEFVN